MWPYLLLNIITTVIVTWILIALNVIDSTSGLVYAYAMPYLIGWATGWWTKERIEASR